MKTKLFLLLTPILLSCFALLPVVRAAPSPSNVNVVNTPNVNVVNTTASPVPVRDVDNPAKQPFQAEVVGGFADGASSTGDITIATVPAGKRLVIEHVSAFGTMLPTQKVINGGSDVIWADPFSTLIVQYHWDSQGSNADGSRDYFVASQLVRFYANPGPIQCFAERDSTAGANPNSVTFTISGYLVDCPECVP